MSPMVLLLGKNQQVLSPAGSSVPVAWAARRYIMCEFGPLFCWQHQFGSLFHLAVGILRTCRNLVVPEFHIWLKSQKWVQEVLGETGSRVVWLPKILLRQEANKDLVV